MDDIAEFGRLDIVRKAGGYANAINESLAFCRTLWRLSFDDSQPRPSKKKYNAWRLLRMESAEQDFSGSQSLFDAIVETITAQGFCETAGDSWLKVHLDLLRPRKIARLIVGDLLEEHNLRYFIMRGIREHYNCVRSPEMALCFKLLSEGMNSLLDSSRPAKSESVPLGQRLEFKAHLVPFLCDFLTTKSEAADRSEGYVNLFFECCRELGYVAPHFRYGCIEVRTKHVDAEFVLAHLFGIRTGIKGFDELFGGGGPILADHFVSPSSLIASERGISGRTILIRGRFGTGKTLLALELAVDAARKGGLAWLIPFEQPAIEHLYTLNVMGLKDSSFSVRTATDVIEAVEVLEEGWTLKEEPGKGEGALIILGAARDSFDDFLLKFEENAGRMRNYPLRLLSVDPFNSIAVAGVEGRIGIRAKLVEMINKVKKEGVNILLVAEESLDDEGVKYFEENVADIVIHLTVESRFGYAQRLIEIKKSRLQREQRGKHPFSIVPGSGIRIYPSSAAVRARIKDRRLRSPGVVVNFGLDSFDEILGQGGIEAGDVIVIQGPARSYKTPLGLPFLLGTDYPLDKGGADRVLSLFIAVGEEETGIRYQLASYARDILLKDNPAKTLRDIEVCSIPSGYINPGYVFQRIEEKFVEVRRRGARIDRVLVDDVSRWEMSSPFVRAEETFGETLVEFLQKKGVTTVYICHDEVDNASSPLQSAIIDNADCLIELRKFEFRGQHRVTLRLVKARGFRHSRDFFELSLDGGGLKIKSTSSLLRAERDGEAQSVRARLFLYAHNSLQESYNESLLERIKAVLLPRAEKAEASYYLMLDSIKLSEFSAVDELQVFQFDDSLVGVLAQARNEGRGLREFPINHFDDRQWKDIAPELRRHVSNQYGFWAVPYYEDLGLLVVRDSDLPAAALNSWRDLARECTRWEQVHEDSVFFAFASKTSDDFNALFLEILSSLVDLKGAPDHCNLHSWLVDPSALEASKILRILCRRAYLAGAYGSPIIWRDWYSGINSLLAGMSRESLARVSVHSIPGKGGMITDWYLGVPSYSAAPNVALEVVKLLTSREAELERVRCGIGLPVRKGYYGFDGDNDVVSSPFHLRGRHFSFPSGGVRRSQIGCYFEVRDLLAQHLKSVIEIEDGSEEGIEGAMRSVFRSLRQSVDFLIPDWKCRFCQRNSSPLA